MTSSDAQGFLQRNGLYLAAGVGISLAAYAAGSMFSGSGKNKVLTTVKTNFKGSQIVMIGDVGGTNIRLQLIKLSGPFLEEKTILKDLVKYRSQEHDSLAHCIKDYLKDVSKENFPQVCVVGMAGPVINNTIDVTVNVKKWGRTDGNQIAKDLGFKKFIFINDFTAAGYGISRIRPKDCETLGRSGKNPIQEGANSVKLVIGPGTGLGQGILYKKEADGFYEPVASEGGHVDFPVISEEDWLLCEFARKFIPNSNNMENLRAKGPVGRISTERLCAGPAIPLIYSFMKSKYKQYDSPLEKEKKFDDITATDIIKYGNNNKDPLCMKTIEKFTSIFGAETGNMSLKVLPYGGVYLIGGVTKGIKSYLLSTDTFMKAFANKGRLQDHMEKNFRVYLVDPEIEVGLLGAEEKARRECL